MASRLHKAFGRKPKLAIATDLFQPLGPFSWTDFPPSRAALLLISIAFGFAGCAAPSSRLNNRRVGMPRDQVNRT